MRYELLRLLQEQLGPDLLQHTRTLLDRVATMLDRLGWS